MTCGHTGSGWTISGLNWSVTNFYKKIGHWSIWNSKLISDQFRSSSSSFSGLYQSQQAKNTGSFLQNWNIFTNIFLPPIYNPQIWSYWEWYWSVINLVWIYNRNFPETGELVINMKKNSPLDSADASSQRTIFLHIDHSFTCLREISHRIVD